MIFQDDLKGKGWLPEAVSDKDFKAEEIFSAFTPVVWKEKPINEWKRYLPIRDQHASNACVAFTLCTVLGNENLLEEGKFPILSPRSIYARGFVPPAGGMYYSQAMKIGNEQGATLEALLPSEGKDEQGMRDLSDEKESDRLAAKIYRGGAFVFLPLDIEAIASFINQGKTIALGTRFNSGGFHTGEVNLTPDGTYGHAITGVDFTIWKGERAIVFQNSWGSGWGFDGLGVVRESQIKGAGLVSALYFQNLNNQEATGQPKPKIQILVPLLKMGDKSGEVGKLQIMLQYLGFFPAGVQTTGNYFGITRQAVKDYQKARLLVQTGIADPITITTINAEFK